jgi:putative endonuclease
MINLQRNLWRKKLGNVGEALVLRYLTQLGWQVVRQKYHVGRSSEVDLIALAPDGTTVFIEVKTRTIAGNPNQDDWYESVSQTINARKQKKIISAARRFKIETQCHGSACRFDVIMLGLSSNLASNLVREFTHGSTENILPSFDRKVTEYVAGGAREHMSVIHCEGVFVTNF